jgi:hypothetical protein
MKTNKIGLLAAAVICAAGLITAQVASAQTVYNTTQTAINGSGNTDLGWSVYSSPNIILSMMSEYNYPGYPDNATAPADPNDGAGTFLFPTGSKPGSPTRGNYDLWFSAETPNSTLADSGLDFYVSFTTTGPGTALGPISLSFFSDNSYGNASTPNGGGATGTYAAESGSHSLMQNAEDPSWMISGYNPNVDQTVTEDLFAVAHGDNPLTATKVADLVGYTQVGNPAPVPEPLTMAVAGIGALILIGFKRSRRSCAV